MANYQELLSRAVDALPDNSGAARRGVYDKARKALVTQLRAISPPLPAREITRHRLELEDCIRQVEYDATEALLGSLKQLDEQGGGFEDDPVLQDEPALQPALQEDKPVLEDDQEPDLEAQDSPAPENITAPDAGDIKAEPEPGNKTDIEPDKDELSTVTSVSAVEHQLQSSMVSGPQDSSLDDFDDQQLDDRDNTKQAMSRVREVELEEATHQENSLPQAAKDQNDGAQDDDPQDDTQKDDTQKDVAQKVVDRAIEVLDREARGEHVPIEEIGLNEDQFGSPDKSTDLDKDGFPTGVDEEKTGNALTIFLVLAIVLLGIVGGGAYWAWREGYVNLDALFAANAPATTSNELTTAPPSTPDPQGKLIDGAANDSAPGPGNTATDNNSAGPSEKLVSAENADKGQEQLPPSSDMAANDAVPTPQMTTAQTPQPEPPTTPATTDGVRMIEPTPGPDTATDANKSEERLTTAPIASEPTLASDSGKNNDTVATGTQSLLLEASADGTTGAVPFSGTVQWSRGLDELGQPTLIGTANIPARNLGVKILIRRNGDPTLPASHLMEIDFTVTPTFVGGSVAGLPGILLKNEELVQGTALIGASARVVGNSFLFALSAAPQDVRTNIDLLKTRKWMDLAIIYATGRRAIITLEKDATAQKMFEDVLAAWQSEAEADAAKASANGG
ncbi:hypothetical protein MNBD_ALPHA12-1111 [hydrothermal vent metagenome]|uniref:CheA signal transduction histidine kinase n=1 Tax=hydrothermal vent metagenome TaxID=652676 RepID=A0A3B0TYQ1_9ZZZZ